MNTPLLARLNVTLMLKTFQTMTEDCGVHIVAIEDKLPVLRMLSNFSRYSITTLSMLSLLVGSFFKIILYRYILVSSKLNNGSYFKVTSINKLLLSSAIIHHLSNIYAGIFLAISIGTDVILEDIFGNKFCHATLFIGKIFLLVYSYVE